MDTCAELQAGACELRAARASTSLYSTLQIQMDGTGNTIARALGYGRAATGPLSVWIYAIVKPEGYREGSSPATEDMVYFVRINKLPRRINVSTVPDVCCSPLKPRVRYRCT